MITEVEWFEYPQKDPGRLVQACVVDIGGVTYPAAWSPFGKRFVNTEGKKLDNVTYWCYLPKCPKL